MWDEADRVMALIKEHLVQRPAMEPRDLYKLLYQGVRGLEHIITSPKAFTERLVEEWDKLDLAEGDPLWESIRPNRSLLRLNLRPFKALGGDLDELAAACLETGRRSWGTQAELQLAWDHFINACRERSWPGWLRMMLKPSLPGFKPMSFLLFIIPNVTEDCTGWLTGWWRLTSGCRDRCNVGWVLTSNGVDILCTGVNDDHAQRTGRQPS
jgi:hypothetical protein